VAGEAGTAHVKVKADTKGFKSEAEHGILGPLKEIAKVAAGLFAAEKIGEFFTDAVKGAADLEQQVYRTGQIFKGQSGTIQAFAKDAADSFGLAEGAALKATAKFGQLFTQMGIGTPKAAEMSVNLTKLAANLAAFTGQPVDTVFQALLRGETGATRGLKQLGVVLTDTQIKQEAVSQGLIKTVKDGLTPAQKAQAIYALVLRQTAGAQDAFNQRSGTLSGQLKILSAEWQNMEEEIGKAVLPTVLRVLSAIRDKAPPALEAFKSSILSGVSVVQSFASAIGPIAGVVFDVGRSLVQFAGVGGIVAFVAGFKAAGVAIRVFQAAYLGFLEVATAASVGEGITAGLLGMVNPAVAAGVAIGGLSLILYKLSTDESDAERATHRLTDAVNELHDAQRGARDAADAKRQADQGVRESNRSLTSSEHDVRQAIQERNRQEQVLETLQAKRTKTLRDSNSSEKDRAAIAKDVADQQKKVAAAEANVVSAYQNHQRAALNLQGVKDASTRAGAQAVGPDLAAAARGAHDFGKSLDLAAVAAKRGGAAFDTYVTSLASAKGPHADVLHAIGEYVKSLGRVPDKKTTQLILNALKASSDIKDFEARLERLPTNKTVNVITNYINRVQNQAPGHVPTQFPPPPPRRARGGYVPGRRSAGDTQAIFATAGEVVLNEDEQAYVGHGLISQALAYGGASSTGQHFQAGGTVPAPTGPPAGGTGGGHGGGTGGVGKKTADEILLEFLNEVRSQLPEKWKQALKDRADAMANAVRGIQSNVSDAFGSVADQAFQAFDAHTERHLADISKRFDVFRSDAEATLGSGLGDTIAQQLRVSMGPAFDALKPAAQMAKIKATQEAFVKDLGKTWSSLPKNVKAGLTAGLDSVTSAFDADMQKIDKTFEDTKSSVDDWLRQQNDSVDQNLATELDSIQSWSASHKSVIEKTIQDELTAWDDAERKRIESARSALTPTEILVAQEQAAHDAASALHDLADAQKAVGDAQAELELAKASGDDQGVLDATQKIADAQAALDEVNYQQKLKSDQEQAQTERDARDAEAQAELDQLAAQHDAKLAEIQAEHQADLDQIDAQAADRTAQAQALADAERALNQAIADQRIADAKAQHDADAAQRQAQYDLLVAQMQAAHDRIVAELQRQQDRESLEYTASRDLQKRHLQARLDALLNELVHERDGWNAHHDEIMRLFRSISGDYREAGQNLGHAFVVGLNQSTGELSGAAEQLAAAIARYLKLHSPAEKGPLSTLHQWFTPFAPTLLRGLDTSTIDARMRSLSRPPSGPPSTLYGAVGDPRVIQRLDALIRIAERQQPGFGRVVVQDDTGRTLNELAAAAGG
jgi:hypothetical protein